MKRPQNALPAACLAPMMIAALALAGCAGETGAFPSLLPRAVEGHDELEPVRVAPPPTVDSALDAAIADGDKRLADSSSRFAAEVDKAAATVTAAAGVNQGSDAWLAAQQALGVLDTAQADTTMLATDLDRMVIDRAQKGLPDYPALSALRGRVQAELDNQAARIAALRGKLKA